MEKKEGVYGQNHPKADDKKAKSVRDEKAPVKEPKRKEAKKKAA